MYKPMVEAMSQMETFLRNSLLLFDDLTAAVREKTIRSNFTNVFSECSYTIATPTWSEGAGRTIFEYDGQFKFAYLLLKTKDDHLSNAASFKAICGELDRDPVFPFIFVGGVLEPNDPTRLKAEQVWYRRAAIEDTLLLGTAPAKPLERTEYKMDSVVSIKYDKIPDWRPCREARFRVWPLEGISDSKVLGEVVDKVLAI